MAIKLYCKKCGFEIRDGWKFCPKCKANLKMGNIETNKEIIDEKIKKDRRNALICIFIFLISTFALFTVNKYSTLFFLISLITIVTGFIKYRNNIIIKILFWMFLIGVILFIVLIIFLIVTCIDMIPKWDW